MFAGTTPDPRPIDRPENVTISSEEARTQSIESITDYHLEIARLRVRIAHLERALEDRERERRQLISQYELVISDLETDLERSESSPAEPTGYRHRLFKSLRLHK